MAEASERFVLGEPGPKGRGRRPKTGRTKIIQSRVDAEWRSWFDGYRRFLRSKERDPYEGDTLVRAIEALARRDRYGEPAPKMAPRSTIAVAHVRFRGRRPGHDEKASS
jgi:hypothetical protein